MFKWIKKLKDFVNGYKVYIIGIATILGLLVAYAEGAISLAEFIKGVWAALIAMGFRSAIEKIKPPA